MPLRREPRLAYRAGRRFATRRRRATKLLAPSSSRSRFRVAPRIHRAHAYTLAYRTRARRTLRIHGTALAGGALTSRAAVSTSNVRRTASQSPRVESRTTLRVAHWRADRPTRQVDRWPCRALLRCHSHVHDFIDKFVLNANSAMPPSRPRSNFLCKT